jgi:hypothetical protein
MNSSRDTRSHNKKLADFIAIIKSDCRDATCQDDMENIAKKIETHTQTSKLKYHHTNAFYIAAFCEIAAAIQWWVGENIWVAGYYLNDNLFYIIAMGCLGLAGPIVLIKSYSSKRHLIQNVSNQLLLKSHLIHNRLESSGYSDRDLRRSWKAEFMGFNRGDESRFINRYYTGSYDFEEIHIDYELFRFHYVIVEIRTITTYNTATKKNETRTETIRHSHYRYGIIMDFPYAQGLCISNEGYTYPEKWTTSSKQFNDKFKVTADQQMTCAKVLQPSVILKLIDEIGWLSDMTLEINRNSKLCLTCINSAILPSHEGITLTDTKKHLHALRYPEINTNLMHVLHGMAIMIKFNDKNFE